MKLVGVLLAVAVMMGATNVLAQTPQPFPGTSPARPAESPAAPTQPPAPPPPPSTTAPVAPRPTAPAASAAPKASVSPAVQAPQGLPVYPTAEFIDGFDAGSGQRYYLYGSDMPFEEIVAYYRTTLKNGGRELFREPPIRQFDLGRFQEDTMAYPPSVVVKDYTWNNGSGYLAVSGITQKRYRTIIQIVPAGPGQ